jgi:PhnB protein
MHKPILITLLAVLLTACSASKKNNSSINSKNMKQSIYFLADGNCSEVMEFYHKIFGGELAMTKVGESGAKDFMPPNFMDKIINARLESDVVDISASDWLLPQRKRVQGNHLCVYIHGGTFDELKSIFDKLSDGGEITDPIKEQFYGVYGALNDKFGNRWMFVTDKKQ